MENTTVTNNETTKPVNYAGFWWRFLAYIIDEIVLSFAMSIVFVPLFAILGVSIWSISEGNFSSGEEEMLAGSIMLFSFMAGMIALVIQWLYYAIMESSKTQGTVGKLALRIKVTDYNGQRISFGRATGRFFGKILSGMILMIGYIMAGFTAKKQALHDILANCYVIKE